MSLLQALLESSVCDREGVVGIRAATTATGMPQGD